MSEKPQNTVARQYPLDVHPAQDDDCCYGFYSKGHNHSADAFRAAVCAYTGEADDAYDSCQIALIWWRAVPDGSGEYSVLYHQAKAGSRGAFPVMLMEYRS